jgi:hypothetical protein
VYASASNQKSEKTVGLQAVYMAFPATSSRALDLPFELVLFA